MWRSTRPVVCTKSQAEIGRHRRLEHPGRALSCRGLALCNDGEAQSGRAPTNLQARSPVDCRIVNGDSGLSHQDQRYSKHLADFIDEAPLERRSIVEFVAAVAASLPPGSRVADVGAGSAPFRELFSHVDYMTIDRGESPHGDASDFDVVASAEDVPLDDVSLDAIVCTQVLEHLPEPAQAVAEFYRLLKPGGRLFLTAPLVWEEHEKPYDFFRYTRSGLEHLLSQAGFERLEITGRTDCFSTLAQLLRNARWSLGKTGNDSDQTRQAAFQRLEQMADELVDLAPLDARRSFPLGYSVVAVRPARSIGPQPATPTPPRANTAPRTPIPVLYLAPWVDLGGSDKGTIDWFKNIDKSRWAPSIITTQPSDNRWLPQIEPYAEEIWPLPELMSGSEFPAFILGFIESREIAVVHIMNSRLAFDLLPDMRCLPHPPVVVVQHHAEEPDRSGYVRYVATRYGNLVDAFSLTSNQLADAVTDYDIPRSRMRVIHTGVDGLGEFNPDLVRPFDLPSSPGSRILWPGRLVAQKDPMLTLDVIRLLADRGLSFSLHVVGDGDMKDEVIARARQLDVNRFIEWHPPSYEMPRWYRSTDLLLMTSVFEGVPYVIFEALVMGVPVVAPALPGNVELMGTAGGALIDPRDDAQAYADAIEKLLRNDDYRRAIGDAARKMMLADHSLADMATQHEELYEHLLAHRPASSRQGVDDPAEAKADQRTLPATVTFPRNPPPERSVAVIVPCYKHGRFLPNAIQSLRDQTLQPTRILVVDDASDDLETTAVLNDLDQDPLVTVIRLSANVGPSVARNRALSEIAESYVLPLDADDMLPPTALEELVEQIERSPESVAFIYPRVRHFGNRHDFYQPPSYNLNILLNNNYCVAASLFDRRVFDAGIRYAEDIVFGHEDWDLVLQMAEYGVTGEVADSATLMYRKNGFSRVNAVEYGPESFHERISRRHPLLYKNHRDQIKAEWAPALSLVLIEGSDPTSAWPDNLMDCLRSQSFADFEVLNPAPPASAGPLPQPRYRNGSHIEEAVEKARGRFVILATPVIVDALESSAFLEQIVRLLWAHHERFRLVLASMPERAGPRLTRIAELDAADAMPCAVAWHRKQDETCEVDLDNSSTVIEDIIMRWQSEDTLEWRMV